ncbi:hypothetical protein [Nostoc sp.]|uniref:hypothetical protein n=1 Tax=Nostoc sp. TaxID=1180 RepID=UPI002FF6821D
MKFIVGLSSLALVSLSSVSPCLAANQSLTPSADQSLPNATKTIQVAGLFDSVNEAINTVDREQRRAAQRAARERARQERLERRENAARARQQRTEAYQKQQQERAAAVAAKREQERKYFESLTPEQQKQYIAQREAREKAAIEGMVTIFSTLGGFMGGGNSAASPEPSSSEETWLREREDSFNSRPEPQPAPAPVTPIGPIYGTGPGGSFYGN